jgi:heme a synthase
MRHEHAGLSIPDFPLAYGEILPDTSAQRIVEINEARIKDDQVPTTATHIWIQMVHRGVALGILVLVAAVAVRSWSGLSHRSAAIWCSLWLCMILVQVGLGAWTIWSNKAADIATAHMALGALSLLAGVLISFRLCRGVDSHRFLSPDVPTSNVFSSVA